ncbi:hypothetical protein DXT99_11675 [Pontibacter diazotrophicus]|uniref:DUF8091 domain-containing protein n=1 Tax=Pontibacter diazotrophicus TaxID=1400979 RepID=A0A3D8LBX4_9BACT|nr:hypothetical protein [Pontibacter diazotrophicus]RDV14941.1 hypothetical protein DXT99_11675 [Pontibacter diazotrophicus]
MPGAAKETEKVVSNGIGLRNERSLHAALKQWAALPEDKFEVPLDGYVIDMVRGDQLIEIQTRNFSAIRNKLTSLIAQHKVHLLHPVTAEKWVVQVDATGQKTTSRRKSPYKGKLTDLFEELVRIPELMTHDNFSLEVLFINEEEVRCRDGKGSKHRKRVSVVDRRLIAVVASHQFSNTKDFIAFIPKTLLQPFSNKDLAASLQLPLHRCRQITYCLRKMGAVTVVGKNRNELLFSSQEGD